MSNRLQEIVDRYEKLEAELRVKAEAIRKDLDGYEKRIAEAKIMRDDARHLLAAHGSETPQRAAAKAATPAPAATPAAPAVAKSAPAAAPTSSRKRSGLDDETIREMGIVDAAIALAKRHGEAVADAGQVLSWFEEVGYESRSGLPSRNSVYVSLNRESKGEGSRIERHDRGQFKFKAD